MAEATHTTMAIFGLRSGIGKGPKIYCGKITIAAAADTLLTPLDVIYSVAWMLEVTALTGTSASSGVVVVNSISNGTITFETGTIVSPSTAATALTGYITVIGTNRTPIA